MKQIRIDHVGKTYGKEKYAALVDLTLEIDTHTIFGFLGPNGAGKTTALKLLTGLMKPTTGEIWIGDTPVHASGTELHQKIGYVAQNPRFYDWMTGYELLIFVGSLYHLSRKEAAARSVELLEICGLSAHKNRKIGNYSGGMVQRLGIAQALMNRPEVLFLDEPVSDMDPIGRKDILDLISSLRGKMTVFMSSHILEDVERVCDTVGIINQGRLIRVAAMLELKREFGTVSGSVGLRFATVAEAQACEFWFREHSPIAEVSRSGNSCTVKQTAFTAERSAFFQWAAVAGVTLEELLTLTPKLEDIFVSIIGGDDEKRSALSSIA